MAGVEDSRRARDSNYSACFDGTPYRVKCFDIGIRFIDAKGEVMNLKICST